MPEAIYSSKFVAKCASYHFAMDPSSTYEKDTFVEFFQFRKIHRLTVNPIECCALGSRGEFKYILTHIDGSRPSRW